MRFRLSLIFLCVIGVIALFWYVGHYYRSHEPSSVSQLQTPPPSVPRPLSSGNATVLATQNASSQVASSKDSCPRESTDNGMLRLSLRSVSTTRQIGAWTPALNNRFVIIDISLEAITDFQLASSAVLWLEEPDGTERSRSVATGVLACPLASLSPYRGERVSGQIAFEVHAQTREFKLHYDPFLARQLTLCASIP